MNILVITTFYPEPNRPDLEENTAIVHYFAKEWVKQGNEVTVLHLYAHHFRNILHYDKKKYGKIQKETYLDGVRVLLMENQFCTKNAKHYTKRQQTKIANEINHYFECVDTTYKPDVMIVHFPTHFFGIVDKLKIGSKKVCVCHFTDLMAMRSNDKYKKYIDSTYKECGARSQQLKKNIEELGLPINFVAYSGIDKDIIINNEELKKKWQKERNEYEILFVGSLLKGKKVDVVLRAIALIKDKINVHFTIVGDGPKRKQLQLLSKKLKIEDNVSFVGKKCRNDVFDYMKKSDMFVMVSKDETLGVTYLEAMSQGCVVIGSKNEGIDGIIVDSKNGYLVETDNPKKLADKIVAITKIPKAEKTEIVENAVNTIKDLTSEKVAEKYLNDVTSTSKTTKAKKLAKKKDSLLKNTALLTAGTIFTKGLLFVMVPFFSKWLSVEDYGVFDVICTYVTLLIPIIGLANDESLFRFSMDVETKEEKKKYVSNCLAIFLINSFVFLIIISLVQYTLNWELGLLFFLLVFSETYNTHLCGYLRAIKRIDIYSSVSALIMILIAAFVTVFVRILGFGLDGIILGYALGYAVGNLIITIITKYWSYLDFKQVSLSEMKELASYSIHLVLNNTAWWFINVSDRTIIRIVLGTVANGIYAIAYKIPNILSSISSVFSISWQQSATESVNDEGRDKYYTKVYNTEITVLLTLCCGVLSLNSWLFNYIFDIKYHDGYLYVPILLCGHIFTTLSQFYGGIQISLKQPKENGKTTIIGAIINILIHLALVNYIGLYAAAISTVISQMVVCVLRYIKVKKVVKINLNKSSIIYFLIYLCFTASAYYIENLYFNITTVILASILVLYANRQFITKALAKLKTVLNK